MDANEVLTTLQNGGKLFFYESDGLTFPGVKPATIDDFTHFIYFDKKWKLFYEYRRKDRKESWVDALRVKRIIDMMVNEQEKSKRLLESKMGLRERSEYSSRIAKRERRIR